MNQPNPPRKDIFWIHISEGAQKLINRQKIVLPFTAWQGKRKKIHAIPIEEAQLKD